MSARAEVERARSLEGLGPAADPAIKTAPFAHQRTAYDAHRDARAFALFWEMGLGKSKTMLDVAAHHFLARRIDALVIVAPNLVHENWAREEIPAHLAVVHHAMVYPRERTQKADRARRDFLDVDAHHGRLRVLCISYDSVSTAHGFEFARQVMSRYRTMMIADESTAIKSHVAIRSKRTKTLGKLAAIRWIATGTPVAQSPFDLHSQMQFLDPEFWRRHGMQTFGAFKNQFGTFVQRRLSMGRSFPELVRYRDLDRLHRLIAPVSSRLLKDDSEIKLPPKMYARRTFALTEEQRAVYDRLRKDLVAELDSGARIEAPLAIVRLMRLQQIACGFVTTEGEIEHESADGYTMEAYRAATEAIPIHRPAPTPTVTDIIPPEENPRLLLLRSILDEAKHKVIVWCRFRRDVDLICDMLGKGAVRYDGAVDGDERLEALRRFRDEADEARVLIANVAAMAFGVTLTIAKTMIYYSNSFSLEKRLQSEDRAHRIGQDRSVLIIDLAAERTVDLHVIRALREKYDIAASVTGDRLREWIAA